MKAKLNIYLAAEGCERLAKHGEESYWHWHIITRVVAVLKGDEWVAHDSGQTTLPEGCKFIGVADVELPGPEEASQAAVGGIRAELARRRAEWIKQETEITRRINELLAISYQEPQK